jgi:hypothetical protein
MSDREPPTSVCFVLFHLNPPLSDEEMLELGRAIPSKGYGIMSASVYNMLAVIEFTSLPEVEAALERYREMRCVFSILPLTFVGELWNTVPESMAEASLARQLIDEDEDASVE